MRIYIIGPCGSGKSTLGKYLSNKLNIKYYELDCVVFDDKNNHRRRTDEEVKEIFDKIIDTSDWIIEDVGRKKFINGRTNCDKIYYLSIGKIEVYKRVITRWIKQRIGKLEYNYPPTLHELIKMIRWTYEYYKNEKDLLNELKKYDNKLEIITKNKLNEMENI